MNTIHRLVEDTETLSDFKKTRYLDRNNIVSQDKPFSFFNSEDCKRMEMTYRRRDFFKVAFLRGNYLIHYGDETLKVDGTTLSIFDPNVPYTVEVINEEYNAGYFIFSDLFYDDYFKQPISKFPLFANGHKTIFNLDSSQEESMKNLFGKIESLNNDNYVHRYDLIRNHINEILHFAINLNPYSETVHVFSSQERLLHVFKELLDRQFPVKSSVQSTMMRKASDFADLLNVHVNYLNRIVRQTTGKSTTRYIWERYLKEAILLLRHTAYSISEIAYSLGFSDASHFNHFFKSMTTAKPSDYRKAIAKSYT